MIGQALLKQYQSARDMILQALDKCDDRFYEARTDWSFNFTIYHIIETMEFYMGDSPEGFAFGKRADISWKTHSKEQIIKKKRALSKKILRKYLNEIWPELEEKISFLDLKQKDDFEWFGSVYEKYLYLLRHTQHHLGELGKTLRDWDCQRMKWT